MIREASELKNSKFDVWPQILDFEFSLNILNSIFKHKQI